MKTLAQTGWKILLLALLGALSAAGLHQIIPASPSMDVPFGPLVEAVGFPAVVVGYFIVTFALLLAVFVLIEERLTGTKLSKGLRYGLGMGLVWYVGLLEASSLAGTTLAAEGIMAIADVIPVIGICILLALWAGTDSPAKTVRPPAWWSILLIALAYCLGRLLIYIVFRLESGYASRTAETLFWTGAMGLSIGAAYKLLAGGLVPNTPREKLLWFGLAFFGLNWWIFNLFVVFVLGLSFWSLTLRAGIDVAFVLGGIVLAEAIRARKTA